MKIGEHVKVCRISALFGRLLGLVQPSMIEGRADGVGEIIGYSGAKEEDFVLVRVGESVGAYFESELEGVDVVKHEASTDKADTDGIKQRALDDAVHDECSKMASSINNDGRVSQIQFLIERGWKNKDFETLKGKKRNG